jgi:serine/threonine protein kinase
MAEPGDISLDPTLPDITSSQSNTEWAKIYSAGDIVGGTYRLKELIGKGGMGYVFCAEHTIIGHDYALKLLAPENSNETNWLRFQSEGKAIAKLNHKNIVHIYNMGVDLEQCPFYVMDLIYGASLAELVHKTGPMQPSVAIEIFLQLCSGLSYAHQRGIIHRDVKPSNIILQDQPLQALQNTDNVPVVKIVDFGIAKLIRIHGDSLQRITNTGQVFGTPLYMSPEQCMGSAIDARSDIYSLGCTLYETLTGQPPFCGQNAMETVLMHLDQEPLRLLQTYPDGGFSQSIELLVAKMLKKDPAQRYQTMAQVSHDLERIKSGKVVVQPVAIEERLTKGYEKADSDLVRHYSAASGKKLQAMVLGAVLVAGLGGWAVYACVQAIKMKQPVVFGAKFGVSNVTGEEEAVRQTFAALPTFSHGVFVIDGQRQRQFEFSKQISAGTLCWDHGAIKHAAKGWMTVPANQPITLELEDYDAYAFECQPDLLGKFAVGDISGIDTNSDEWPSFLKQVGDWNNLNELTLRKARMGGEDIRLIDTLKHLTFLSLNDCEFNPKDICSLKVLRRLKMFQLISKDNGDEIIETLAGSKNIQWLAIGGWPCTAITFSHLAQCPNLMELHISANGLKDQDLLILEKLHHLKLLDLSNTQLTPASIGYLRRLHSVGILSLGDLNWSKADINRLKREVPAYWRQGSKLPSSPI